MRRFAFKGASSERSGPEYATQFGVETLGWPANAPKR
jgi:hypothetical protein